MTQTTDTITVQVIDGTRTGALPDVLLDELPLEGELDLEALKRWALHRHEGFATAGIGIMSPTRRQLVEVVLTDAKCPTCDDLTKLGAGLQCDYCRLG